MLSRSPTFAVVHHDGSVEVFDVNKKRVSKKQADDECLTHVGLLTVENIKVLLKEGTKKQSVQIYSKVLKDLKVICLKFYILNFVT